MAAEIPPDYFPTSPTLSGAGAFPDNMPAPDAGIFDAPAHIAIINQQWVTRLLGMLDGLMYPEAWESQDAENAYNELLELQAMLMSPANFLIPSDTFQNVINLSSLPIGNTTANQFTVPPGKRYRITAMQFTVIGGSPSLISYYADHSGKITPMIRSNAPVSGLAYGAEGEFWLYPGDKIAYVVITTATGASLYASTSGLVYDEV